MLKHLRRKEFSKKILWAISVVIILSFGVFGSSNYMTRKGAKSLSSAGSIFGKRISLEEFQESYLHAQHQALLQYGENYNRVSQFVNLQAEAWDRLILLYEARKRRLRISDKEVVDAIAQIPMFQRNGKFDPLLYNDILRYVFKTRARFFEEGVRSTLIFNKIYRDVIERISISDEELRADYDAQNMALQVSYAFIRPEDFLTEASFEESEARAYFDAHAAEFALPPSVNVEYIKLSFPESADDAAKESVGQKAQELYQALSANPDFAQVAQQFQQEVKETGFFSEDRPNLDLGWSFELLQQVFQLPDQKIGEPVATDEGYFIVRVKERRDASPATYEEAHDKIMEALKTQSAWEVADQKSREIAQQIQNALTQPGMNFMQAASQMSLKLQQTPAFHRGQYLPGIGISKEFQDAAFALSENAPMSAPVKTAKGFCILHLDARFPTDENKYQQEKETFRNSLLVEKSNAAINELMAQLRLQADLKDNLSQLNTSTPTAN